MSLSDLFKVIRLICGWDLKLCFFFCCNCFINMYVLIDFVIIMIGFKGLKCYYFYIWVDLDRDKVERG